MLELRDTAEGATGRGRGQRGRRRRWQGAGPVRQGRGQRDREVDGDMARYGGGGTRGQSATCAAAVALDSGARRTCALRKLACGGVGGRPIDCGLQRSFLKLA